MSHFKLFERDFPKHLMDPRTVNGFLTQIVCENAAFKVVVQKVLLNSGSDFFPVSIKAYSIRLSLN